MQFVSVPCSGKFRLMRKSRSTHYETAELYASMTFCRYGDNAWEILEWDSVEDVREFVDKNFDILRGDPIELYPWVEFPNRGHKIGDYAYIPDMAISMGEFAFVRLFEAHRCYLNSADCWGQQPPLSKGHVRWNLRKDYLENKIREGLCKCGAEPHPKKISVFVYDPITDKHEGVRNFCFSCWAKHRRLEARLRDVRQSRKLMRQMKGLLNGKSKTEHDRRSAPLSCGHDAGDQGGQCRERSCSEHHQDVRAAERELL